MKILQHKFTVLRSIMLITGLFSASLVYAAAENAMGLDNLDSLKERITTKVFSSPMVDASVNNQGGTKVIKRKTTVFGVKPAHLASHHTPQTHKTKTVVFDAMPKRSGVNKVPAPKSAKTDKAKSKAPSLALANNVKRDKPKLVMASSHGASLKKNIERRDVGKGVAMSNHNVSLNFQNIKTRSLLQLLAKTSGLNFIISENVKGNMTLHLKNVPWKQALDIILKANGLDSRRYGDVILIAPIQELAENEINALTARQRVQQLAPLHSEILRLNYANANDIAVLLRGEGSSILSARGQVGVDSRTNSLWIRDLKSNIKEIKYFVGILDIPAQQVLIEARLVSIEKKFTRDIGVRFGVSRKGRLSHKLLKPDGGVDTSIKGLNDVNNRLIFDIPSTLENAASLALSLVRLGSKNFLDLELSALEKENHAETISTPRLITSNQKEAIIEEGEEIPYLTASSSGATSVEFKKAVLSLKITPQITPDRNIVLQLRVTQDSRGEQIKVNNSNSLLPPAINTKEVQSQVFLRNGQTVVIGGIYHRFNRNEVQRVPFFGDLPIVGALFRQTTRVHDQKELLVFITPRIIDRKYLGPKYHLGHNKCCDTIHHF